MRFVLGYHWRDVKYVKKGCESICAAGHTCELLKDIVFENCPHAYKGFIIAHSSLFKQNNNGVNMSISICAMHIIMWEVS